jgi:RNA polymerase sigma-70 factor (ECF subfamily)
MRGVLPDAPRVELRDYRGELVLLHWYAHADGEAVRAVTRVEAEGERLSRLRNYFFSSDLVSEVCAELAVPCRVNGYRWWLSGSC